MTNAQEQVAKWGCLGILVLMGVVMLFAIFSPDAPPAPIAAPIPAPCADEAVLDELRSRSVFAIGDSYLASRAASGMDLATAKWLHKRLVVDVTFRNVAATTGAVGACRAVMMTHMTTADRQSYRVGYNVRYTATRSADGRSVAVEGVTLAVR